MDWNDNWDEKAGLWQKPGPGHVPSTKDLKIVHAGPEAAGRLLTAARKNALQEIDSERVLQTLYKMQWKENDPLLGCMKWYYEENSIADTNAAFFTGLNLIVLRICYYERLTAGGQKVLDDILAGLNIWFRSAAQESTLAYYPNKYLGDLVCKWLLTEILGASEEDGSLPDLMRRGADYFLKHHWGWGEHMSDSYSTVCLHELSVLLLLAKQLPEDIRQAYLKLADELLTLEDVFENGPRVPALRSYAFTKPVPHRNFRDTVIADDGKPRPGRELDFGAIWHEFDWHDIMPERKEKEKIIHIPCYGGSMATAFVEKDIRLGTMDRFPIMPTAEHATWGLCWQCFPAAMSRGTTDWGFLQWETLEGDKLRAHPANGGPPVHIPKTLSDMVQPPVSGETFALQRGSDVLILRVMRCIPQSWESVTDRFRLLAMTAKTEECCCDDWKQLLLHYPERSVSVNFISLSGGEKSELVQTSENSADWNHSFEVGLKDHQEQRLILHLWAISLDGKIETPPQISIVTDSDEVRSAEEKVRVIDWKWNNTHWKVNIDPLRADVMQAF